MSLSVPAQTWTPMTDYPRVVYLLTNTLTHTHTHTPWGVVFQLVFFLGSFCNVESALLMVPTPSETARIKRESISRCIQRCHLQKLARNWPLESNRKEEEEAGPRQAKPKEVEPKEAEPRRSNRSSFVYRLIWNWARNAIYWIKLWPSVSHDVAQKERDM